MRQSADRVTYAVGWASLPAAAVPIGAAAVFFYADRTHWENFKMAIQTYDFANRLACVPLLIETGVAAARSGQWRKISERASVGQAWFGVGLIATGAPTAFSANVELWEADDDAGTNATQAVDIFENPELLHDMLDEFAGSLTDSGAAMRWFHTERTKEYQQLRITDVSFTGGTSPAVSAVVVGVVERQSWGGAASHPHYEGVTQAV